MALDPLDAYHGSNCVFRKWFDRRRLARGWSFALSVGVGLTPEMLPMIITASLAKGSIIMAKEKVVIKKLNAIQDLGAIDILCTDKTGTLTQDEIVFRIPIRYPWRFGYGSLKKSLSKFTFSNRFEKLDGPCHYQ